VFPDPDDDGMLGDVLCLSSERYGLKGLIVCLSERETNEKTVTVFTLH